jgi:hypothetical protein
MAEKNGGYAIVENYLYYFTCKKVKRLLDVCGVCYSHLVYPLLNYLMILLKYQN